MDMPDREPLSLALVAGHPTKVLESCVRWHLSLGSKLMGQFIRRVHGGRSSSRDQELYQRLGPFVRLAN